MTRRPDQSGTKANQAAAARLKAIWRAMPNRPTQQALADAWGESANQSLISQYMNGKIPLNYRAVLFFAEQLRCDQRDIRDDLPEQRGPAPVRPAAASQPERLELGTFVRTVKFMQRIAALHGATFDPLRDADLFLTAYEVEARDGAEMPPANLLDFGEALRKRMANRGEKSDAHRTGKTRK